MFLAVLLFEAQECSPAWPDLGTGLGSAVAATVSRENGFEVPGIDDLRASQVLGALVRPLGTWWDSGRVGTGGLGDFANGITETARQANGVQLMH